MNLIFVAIDQEWNEIISQTKIKIDLSQQLEERITSGIPGFDERIGNGFIRGTTTAIIGAAGTAKSTFSFQFISEGIRKDEPGIACTH